MLDMRAVVVAAVMCGVLGVSQALFFWGSSGRQQAQQEIDPTCENRIESGDCSFYTCFDVRHPCESHNWALSYGWRYCSHFNREYSRFTPDGQKWINSTRKCTMQKLLEFYREEYMNCEDVEYELKAAHAECGRQHGVCQADMLMDNRQALMDVYKFSRRALVRFSRFVKTCGDSGLDTITTWMSERGSKKVKKAFDQLEEFFSLN